LTCVIVPLCIRPNGQLVSPRKFHAQERRALEAIEPDAVVYNDRIADWATDRKADRTGARLADLWTTGTPIDGDGVVDSFEARRQAILAYWDSRTDSEWGDQIRGRIESFIRGEVQQGDHPFTVATRSAGLRLRPAAERRVALTTGQMSLTTGQTSLSAVAKARSHRGLSRLSRIRERACHR
jgi:hypothetical protein